MQSLVMVVGDGVAGEGVDLRHFRAAAGPIVDVRSPSEFAQGHWPGSVNIPLFNDDQRAEVGLTYKEEGRLAATQLGLAAIGPQLADLADALRCAAGADGQLRLYCWRGGLRSNSVAWLARLVDLNPTRLDGGYKSYRRWVLASFEEPWPLRLLGGRTGTGKTDLLLALAQREVAVVDLEGLAHHRGSSFGGLGLPEQPSTEHYENRLAEALDLARHQGADQIWLEAESAQVGRCRIPNALFRQMQSAPVLEIRRNLEERVAQLVTVYGSQGREPLLAATERISRRLGPQRTKEAIDAIQEQDWARACRAMLDYYDRCYDHELARSPARQSVDLDGLSADQAADALLHRQLIEPRQR